MKLALALLACLLLGPALALAADAEEEKESKEILEWGELPELPDKFGFGGPFAGVSNDALIIAGGANFPVSLFQGGRKMWHDTAFVLEKGAGEWLTGLRLPRPLAYGFSVTTDKGALFGGGCNAEKCFAEVYRVTWDREKKKLAFEELPPLPKPRAFTCAALVGTTVYVAGGAGAPDPRVPPTNDFWALDLSKPKAELKWETLEPWPGPAREKAVAGALGGAFYLFSGTGPVRMGDGTVHAEFLTDAWRFDPREKAWKQLKNLPWPVVAAPSPAPALGQSHLIVLGGDDGANADKVFELREKHPGLLRTVLAYHTITDTWAKVGTLPESLVTTNTVPWAGGMAVTSGEVRPGVRTPKVYLAKPKDPKASFGAANYTVLGAYLAVLVAMGIYFSKRERTTADFF